MKRRFSFEKFLPFFSFLLPLLVFLKTLSPTVNFGDSGELIMAAYTLGIPHPPGFPLWNLLAHPFTWLPLGKIAFRINLSSAFFAALTTFFLFKTLVFLQDQVWGKSKEKRFCGSTLASVLTLAFSFTFWRNAVVTEVYALGCLFVVLALFSFLKSIAVGGTAKVDQRLFFLATAFLLGAGICVHYFLLPLLPAFGIGFFLLGKFEKKGRLALGAGAVFLLGLSFFLYLPIRSGANPPIDWGNPEDLAGLLSVVQRKQFSFYDQASLGVSLPVRRSASVEALVKRVFSSAWAYLHILGSEFSGLGFIAGLLGLGVVFWKNWKVGLFLFLGFLLSGYGFAFAISETKPLFLRTSESYLPSLLFFSCFFGLGLGTGVNFLVNQVPRTRKWAWVLAIVLPAFLLIRNFSSNDFSQNRVAWFHAQNILKTAGENSIILAEENNWIFPLAYLVTAEETDQDTLVFDRNANIFDDLYQGVKKSMVEEVWEVERNKVEEELIAKTTRKVFYAADKRFENYRYPDATPAGILYQRGAEEPVEVDFAAEYANILKLDKVNFYDSDTYFILGHYHLQYAYDLERQGKREEALEELKTACWFGKLNVPLLNNAAVLYYKLGEIDLAIKIYERAVVYDPFSTVGHRNLGVLYEKKGRLEEAEAEYEQVIKIKPTFVAAIVSLADLRLRQGGVLAALNGYRQALLVNPANQVAKAKILKVLKESSPGSEAELASFLEAFLKDRPREPEFYLEYGRLLIDLGEPEKARQVLDKVLEAKPDLKDQIEEIWSGGGKE